MPQTEQLNFRVPIEKAKALNRLQEKLGLDTRNELLNRAIDIFLQIAEDPNVQSIGVEDSTQESTPKRSCLTSSPVELAYMKEKARQKARTEAIQERAQNKEEFRLNREEREKKRQEERNPTRYMTNEEWKDFTDRMNRGGFKNYFGNA